MSRAVVTLSFSEKMQQLSPSAFEQARVSVSLARKAFRGAALAWFICTDCGRRLIDEHRAWLKEKPRHEDAKHVLVDRVDSSLKTIASTSEITAGDVYETASNRRAIQPGVLEIKLGSIKRMIQDAEDVIADVKRARRVSSPAPKSLRPFNDGTDFYKAFCKARDQLRHELYVFADMDVMGELEKEQDAAVEEVLRVE